MYFSGNYIMERYMNFIKGHNKEHIRAVQETMKKAVGYGDDFIGEEVCNILPYCQTSAQ